MKYWHGFHQLTKPKQCSSLYGTVIVRAVECTSAPEAAVTVVVNICVWLLLLTLPQPVSTVAAHIPTHKSTKKVHRCEKFFRRLAIAIKGSSNKASATIGILLRDAGFFSSIALWGT